MSPLISGRFKDVQVFAVVLVKPEIAGKMTDARTAVLDLLSTLGVIQRLWFSIIGVHHVAFKVTGVTVGIFDGLSVVVPFLAGAKAGH